MKRTAGPWSSRSDTFLWILVTSYATTRHGNPEGRCENLRSHKPCLYTNVQNRKIHRPTSSNSICLIGLSIAFPWNLLGLNTKIAWPGERTFVSSKYFVEFPQTVQDIPVPVGLLSWFSIAATVGTLLLVYFNIHPSCQVSIDCGDTEEVSTYVIHCWTETVLSVILQQHELSY